MIPNLRVIFAAVLASVAALCCGFGLFAAVRVNHAPLARLPAGPAPIQLVDTAPPAATLVATQSFGARFQLNEALIAASLASLSARQPDSASAAPQPIDHDNPASALSSDTAAVAVPADQAPADDHAAAAAPPATDVAALPVPTDQAPADEHSAETADSTADVPAVLAAADAVSAERTEHAAAGKTAVRRRIAHRVRRVRPIAVAQTTGHTGAVPRTAQAKPEAVGGPFIPAPAPAH
jgi:hypothetical protein